MTNKSRDSSIELLRIVSMMLIIIFHFATHGGFEFSNQSLSIPRLWWGFLEMGGNFGVVIFVFISGYFMIENNTVSINWHKLLKFWAQIFFYSFFICLIWLVFARNDIDTKEIITHVFPISRSNWWFASTYFVMFLIHPYLNRFLHTLSKKQYQKFIMIQIVIFSLVPIFTGSHFQTNELLEFIMYYSIAAYIKLYGFNNRYKLNQYILIWLIITIITYLTCVIFMIIGIKFSIFSNYCTYFYKRNSILTILGAISFFMIFVELKLPNNKWINSIAASSFGVYLIHDDSLVKAWLWLEVFRNSIFQNSNWIILYSVGVTFLVYTCCTLIDKFREIVFEKIYMNMIYSLFNFLHDISRNLISKIKVYMQK